MCYLKPIGKCLLDARDKDGDRLVRLWPERACLRGGLFDFSVYRTKEEGR